MTFVEGDLEIEIGDAVRGEKFDGAGHGLLHCMKAVDFVVELADRYLFIELKDPQHPRATPQSRNDFIEELRSGRLDNDLKYKYRDSFLYEWAGGRAERPIEYRVLIALDTLDAAQLLDRTESLVRNLPTRGPGDRPWPRPIVDSCAVYNLDSWNQTFPHHPARRGAVVRGARQPGVHGENPRRTETRP